MALPRSVTLAARDILQHAAWRLIGSALALCIISGGVVTINNAFNICAHRACNAGTALLRAYLLTYNALSAHAPRLRNTASQRSLNIAHRLARNASLRHIAASSLSSLARSLSGAISSSCVKSRAARAPYGNSRAAAHNANNNISRIAAS